MHGRPLFPFPQPCFISTALSCMWQMVGANLELFFGKKRQIVTVIVEPEAILI